MYVCMYVCVHVAFPGAVHLFLRRSTVPGMQNPGFFKNHGVFYWLIVGFNSAATKFCFFFPLTKSTGNPHPVLDIFFQVDCRVVPVPGTSSAAD
jgi:hypothetical protein